MAYRNEYRYKGGTRRARETRKAKKNLRVAGWFVLWLFIGMFVTHLIFSVVANVKKRSAELDSIGVPPIVTIQDAVNAVESDIIYFDGDLSNSYEVDEFISYAKTVGMDGVMIDLKPKSGILGYKSGVTEAKRILAVPETAVELENIVVKFKNADIRLIARLSLYADDVYAVANPKDAAKNSHTVTVPNTDGSETEQTVTEEALWLDSEKHAWISPYSDGIREYVGKLISEITSAGVDTVLLDNVFFPSNAQGNSGTVVFAGSEESEVPRAGVLRTNISYLKSVASAGGAKLYVSADARAVCGEQDEVAGVTFNIFELDVDGICPICLPSDFTDNDITSIADFEFENGESVELAKLFEALVARFKLIQGAIDTPPAIIPIVQAYTDTSVPAAIRRQWTPADLTAELDELKKGNIGSKVIYGTRRDYEALILPPEVPAEPAE